MPDQCIRAMLFDRVLGSVLCCLQFIIRTDPVNMSPQRLEIQECFLRAGAEFDSWQYTWRVRGRRAVHVLAGL
jgi:hypothetical protein